MHVVYKWNDCSQLTSQHLTVNINLLHLKCSPNSALVINSVTIWGNLLNRLPNKITVTLLPQDIVSRTIAWEQRTLMNPILILNHEIWRENAFACDSDVGVCCHYSFIHSFLQAFLFWPSLCSCAATNTRRITTVFTLKDLNLVVKSPHKLHNRCNRDQLWIPREHPCRCPQLSLQRTRGSGQKREQQGEPTSRVCAGWGFKDRTPLQGDEGRSCWSKWHTSMNSRSPSPSTGPWCRMSLHWLLVTSMNCSVLVVVMEGEMLTSWTRTTIEAKEDPFETQISKTRRVWWLSRWRYAEHSKISDWDE